MRAFGIKNILKTYRYHFLLLGVLTFCSCMFWHSLVQRAKLEMGFFDYVLLVFGGMREYNRGDMGFILELPYFWIGMYFLIMYICFQDIKVKLEKIGIQLFTRMKERRTWFKKEFFQIIHIVIISLVVIYTVIFLFWVVFSRATILFNPTIQSSFNRMALDEFPLTIYKVVINVMVIGGLITIAMMEILFVLSLIFKGIGGYLGMIILFISAIFISTPLLVPNMVMAIRINQYGLVKGAVIGLGIFMMLMPSLYIIGRNILEKKQII